MIRQYFQEFFDTRSYVPKARHVDPFYLKDPEVCAQYCRDGYAVVRQAVPEEAIRMIEDTFSGIQQLPGYFEAGSFMPSPQYGKEIQQYVQEKLNEAARLILPAIADTGECLTGFFSLLVLKFPYDKKPLFPHQDISFIDESEATGAFLWIPVSRIDETNGALWVLPGSHRWAAWQRIHDQYDAPYNAHRDLLLPHMKPVYLEKGDLIILDSAIIHASAPNLSGETRIAMNTSIIPRGYDMVHYSFAGCPKGMIRKYHIDPDFFRDICYIDPDQVPERYPAPQTEPLRYQGRISKRNLLQLLENESA